MCIMQCAGVWQDGVHGAFCHNAVDNGLCCRFAALFLFNFAA